jgi:serine-type D-Ala-D-Ala carboxypeptidase (penicillin-binding protein 5/6)
MNTPQQAIDQTSSRLPAPRLRQGEAPDETLLEWTLNVPRGSAGASPSHCVVGRTSKSVRDDGGDPGRTDLEIRPTEYQPPGVSPRFADLSARARSTQPDASACRLIASAGIRQHNAPTPAPSPRPSPPQPADNRRDVDRGGEGVCVAEFVRIPAHPRSTRRRLNSHEFSYGVLACMLVLLLAAPALAQPTSLEDRVQRRVDDHQGTVAVAIRHLGDGQSVLVNADEPMPTASLIKVAVMIEAYRQAEAGKLDLGEILTLQEEDKVQGSGILTPHFSAGTRLSLRDAIRLMMRYSDNTATNLVAGKVGLENVAKAMEELGLPETKMHAFVFRGETSIFPDRSRKYGLGSTSAREMLTLLEKLHNGELAGEKHTAAMLEHLCSCESTERIPKLLPAGTKVAHKTGSVSAVRTDAGIVEAPNGAFVVVVLTSENADRRWVEDNAANLLIAGIARDCWDHFEPARQSVDPAEPQILRSGAGGWLVEALQRTLNDRLEPSPELSVDGDYGSVTQAAVERFQQVRELPVTGVVDAKTWQALGPLITSDVVITDPDAFDLKLSAKEPADELDGLPFVTCRGWVVADAASGEVVGGADLDTPRENASTTKLMTAWLVLKLAAEDPGVLEETATVSHRAADTPGSTAKLEAGETLSVKDLLYGLLLPSGNDASVVIAEHFGGRFAPPEDDGATDETGGTDLEVRPTEGDPLVRFVAEMNRTAADLGMSRTTFKNPHGLSARGHRTTPRDLMRLAVTMIEQGDILPYVQTRKYVGRLQSNSHYTRYELWSNTNQLLGTEGYLGMKTGTTRGAGACLVSLSHRGDRRLIAIVLGSTSSDARYVDTRNLFRWAWRQ